MRAPEWVAAVESYGVKVPRGAELRHRDEPGSHGTNQFYRSVLGLKPTGTGNHRNYNEADVRRTVAYCLWLDLTGKFDEEAVHLIATYDHGWVISSSIGVWWTPMPSPHVFRNGAICVPIPEWNPPVRSTLI